MKERDMDNINEMNPRETMDSYKLNCDINSTDDDRTRLSNSYIDFNQSKKLKNSNEELMGIPPEVKNYLDKNNLCLATFDRIEPVQIIKAALLQKNENRAKDFSFQFNEEQEFYFFITKEYNPNYLKPMASSSSDRKKRLKKEKRESKERESLNKQIENKKINLNFDYNKYILKAVLAKKQNSGKFEIFCQEILNREVCQVSHTTLDSIAYYKNTKTIKPDKAKKNFESFALLIPEKYYLIEIEKKKPANETIIKEDGIISVLYLITPKKSQTIHLFTMVKYSIYFIRETLCNYIGKYIHDMIYDFCHLPSECFDDFLSHIGSLTPTLGSNHKLLFPLKKYIKTVESLSHTNLINHMYRNLPNISRPKAADRVPFHKFIFMYEKYKLYYAEKEFKIKQKKLNEKKTKKFLFLKPSIIHDPVNDRITKEHKINLNVLIRIYFEILEKFLKENLSQDKKVIRNFLIQSLCKFLIQYSSFKGFFNLDIVMNEDNMFEFQCTANKNINRTINHKMFGCVVNSLACINYIFGFNEGFFHKHFSIMDYSYNFNEKNVIHTFLCINDSSKKNKVRIYDIPFMEKWAYQIAGLLLTVYRDSFGFLCNKNYIKNQKTEIDFHANFAKLFSEIHQNIIDDVFKYYAQVLPDFYKFCTNISVSPLDKYNCLDNLCQNFTNNSLKALVRNSIIFFSPFDVVYNINNDKVLNLPNLNTILEPYLILVDEKLKAYLDKKAKKEEYLKENQIDIKSYFKQLKFINTQKIHYTVFLTDKKDKQISDDEEEEDLKENNIISTKDKENDDDEDDNEKNEIINDNKSDISTDSNNTNSNNNELLNVSINISDIYPTPKKMHTTTLINKGKNAIDNESFDFYFLFNLYYNYTYQTMKELKTIFVDYDIIRRYISSNESSVTISFNDYDKTIIKSNQKEGGLENIKKLKKTTKKNIIKDLIIMSKLTRMTRHMNYIFIEYVNKVVNDIIYDSSSRIAQKNAQEEKYYIKIGHYIINFLAYEKNGTLYNSFKFFKESEIYKKLEDESYYLDAIKISNQ